MFVFKTLVYHAYQHTSTIVGGVEARAFLQLGHTRLGAHIVHQGTQLARLVDIEHVTLRSERGNETCGNVGHYQLVGSSLSLVAGLLYKVGHVTGCIFGSAHVDAQQAVRGNSLQATCCHTLDVLSLNERIKLLVPFAASVIHFHLLCRGIGAHQGHGCGKKQLLVHRSVIYTSSVLIDRNVLLAHMRLTKRAKLSIIWHKRTANAYKSVTMW